MQKKKTITILYIYTKIKLFKIQKHQNQTNTKNGA